LVLVSVVLAGLAGPALAAETVEAPSAAAETEPGASADLSQGLAIVGIGLGCALIIVGAGLGIGKIGAAAVESIARQPEMGDNIRNAMLIAAAFIEGVTFFALIICLVAVFWLFL
jgi:F-type H+-transporting ATPase subunit c